MEGIEHSATELATELAGDQGARYSSGGVAQDRSLRGREWDVSGKRMKSGAGGVLDPALGLLRSP